MIKLHSLVTPVLAVALFFVGDHQARADFLDDYPNLKSHIFREPETPIHFGFGAAPVRIMKNKAGVAVSIFQVHLNQRWLDWELFNATMGFSISSEDESRVNSFTFRTTPKFKITDGMSVGPLLGYEFVSFPDVNARLLSDGRASPFEPYSSRGLIFGAAVSQTFDIGQKYKLKLHQIVYKQTYSTSGTYDGWEYNYENNDYNLDATPLSPGPVFLLEFSLLY